VLLAGSTVRCGLVWRVTEERERAAKQERGESHENEKTIQGTWGGVRHGLMPRLTLTIVLSPTPHHILSHAQEGELGHILKVICQQHKASR